MSNQKNNFVIASLGASGTNFLYKILSRDVDWEVHHEKLRHKKKLLNDREANSLLNANKVGYINGFAWHNFSALDANRFTIVRNPYDLAVSWYNRREGKLGVNWIDGFNEDLKRLDGYCKVADQVFYFEKIFDSTPFELETMLSLIGPSVKLEKSDLNHKVNHNKRRYAKTFKDLPKEFREALKSKVDWFYKKHYV